jgi:methylated-DNA-[protein]-cysteine S-methyltransferase
LSGKGGAYAAVLAAPFGRLGVRLQDGGLSAVEFVSADTPLRPPCEVLGHAVAEQMQRYFADPCSAFTVPVVTCGTSFQRRVWAMLGAIPVGATRRYGDIAAALRTGARAVGLACRANPIPIVVPCHRVVAARGLGGYAGENAGQAMRVKAWLLSHEQRCGESTLQGR